MDYIEIGPVPSDESCEQVGTSDYDLMRARAECRAFIGQIRRDLGVEPEGAKLIIRSNPHDFGTYYEVAVRFSEDSEDAVNYAFRVESDAPVTWDAEARKELGL